MAKILRKTGDVAPFASNSTGTNRTVFGPIAQSDTLDDNVTSEFLEGWEIVAANEFPKLQDYNALGFTLSQYIAYMHQMGVPEWDGGQEYQIGSIAPRAGVLYSCKTADHVSATPPELDAANWKPSVSYSKGHVSGLETSNGTDADHDIDIAVGSASDSLGAFNIDLLTSITKQIDADWAEGNNAGGIASAVTLSADTTYHLFLIAKSDGTVDAGWDTSLTASNLLSDATDYVHYRHIFSNMTDSSSNIINYKQSGDYVYLNDVIVNYNLSSIGTSRVLTPVSTPVGISSIGIISCNLASSAASNVAAWVNAVYRTDVTPDGTNRDLFVASASGGKTAQVEMNILTNNLSEIAFRLDQTSANIALNIKTKGYIMQRGGM